MSYRTTVTVKFSWGWWEPSSSTVKPALQPAAHLGHRWELYALWTWIPAFITASAAAGYTGGTISGATIDMLAFGAITARGLGFVWGGWAADQIVSERLVNLSMAASGAPPAQGSSWSHRAHREGSEIPAPLHGFP